MRIPLLVIFLLILCGAHSVEAQNTKVQGDAIARYQPIYDKCIEKNRVDTPTGLDNDVVAVCSGLASDAAKKDLNSVYKQLSDYLEKNDSYTAEMLDKAQKSWITYRDNSCALEGLINGSPSAGVCQMRMNALRVDQIRSLLP